MSAAAVLPQVQNNVHTRVGRADPYLEVVPNGLLARSAPRLLSFGCSEGYECLSLAARFPDATIFGCDVNPTVLEKAQGHCAGLADVFLSSAAGLAARGPFDLITVFNVLCRYPATKGLENISQVFPVALFDEVLAMIDAVLAPGGLLFLRNAQYFLQETALSHRYEAIATPAMPDSGFLHRHARDGTRATDIRYRFENGEELDGRAGQVRLDAAQAEGKNLVMLRKVIPLLDAAPGFAHLDVSAQLFRKLPVG